jgi:hypothetical protein
MKTTKTKVKTVKDITIVPSDSIVIKEVCDRGKLGEGRNNGMAFAFLKKVGDNSFETVNAMSPCKDYLAEVTLTENTGIPTKGYGLVYKKKLDIFSDVAFMAIKILKTKQGTYNYSSSFDNDVKMLDANYLNIQKLMNEFEEMLGFSNFTKIEKAEDDYFLVTLPVEWTISTHAVSLYTLLLRMGMASDGKESFHDFYTNYKYNGGDKSLSISAKPKIDIILSNKKLPPMVFSYNKEYLTKGGQSPHNHGIIAWTGKYEEGTIGD